MQVDYVHLFDFGGCNLNPGNGRQLNFLDYSEYFAEKYPEQIQTKYLIDNKNSLNHFRYHKSFYYHPTINKLRKIKVRKKEFIEREYFNEHREVLFCDFVTLYMLIQHDVPINYEKIEVFDCLELTVFFRNLDAPSGIRKNWETLDLQKIFNWIKANKDRVNFLVTDYNFDDLKQYDLNFSRYFKKINFDLFNKEYIKGLTRQDDLIYYYAKYNQDSESFHEFINTIEARHKDIKLTNEYLEIWKHKTILYTQKPYVGNIEQFGRMVFELMYFNYFLIIDPVFKNEEKTGLDYYLEHYDSKVPNLMNEDFLNEIQL